MSSVYIYVVDRDFGFAPNPFSGICTLATCKPGIRNTASDGDWIIGVGGGRLKAKGRCIFAMKVTKKITYNEYWNGSEYKDKKPVRNGSKKMMLGDNIYHQDINSNWLQAHSHHSMEDGTVNIHNLNRDTSSKNVLISKHFYYFGKSAPLIPSEIIEAIGYKNQVGHRRFKNNEAIGLIEWLETEHGPTINLVLSDPFDFDNSKAHYSVLTNKTSKK